MLSWACFGPIIFVGVKFGLDYLTRKTREKSHKKKDKSNDARSSEIDGAFKNMKTLKLYAWSDIFA